MTSDEYREVHGMDDDASGGDIVTDLERMSALPDGPNPGGLCMCGCGGETPISPVNRKGKGHVAGEHVSFIRGHNGRLQSPEYLVDPDTGCWIWQRSLDHQGYGLVHSGGKTRLAHRFYFEALRGAIRDGLSLDHLCRNPRCVNPAHLEPVTTAENNRRSSRTKLTWAVVNEIRTRYALGGVTPCSMAAQYGVVPGTIRKIIRGLRWSA